MQEKYFYADWITLLKMVPRFLRKMDSMLRELAEILQTMIFDVVPMYKKGTLVLTGSYC